MIADMLRRGHLLDGVRWSAMAVLVRSAVRQVPLLRRALAMAGVPAVVAGDELPLSEEPGARPLLLLLRCALQPGVLDEEAAAELLTGPLGGTDALGLRRLRRSLRAVADAAGEEPSGEPLASALRDPRELTLIDGPAGGCGAAGCGPAGRGEAERRDRRDRARGALGRLGRVRPWPGLAGGECGRRVPWRRRRS